MLTLGKYSIGVGDRFAHQAKAQLQACILAAKQGVEVIPVWNKSNREHTIIGSEPGSVLTAAKAAVKELGWTKPYHLDADHIRLETVDRFLTACDFYTIDVADSIGQPADAGAVQAFAAKHAGLTNIDGSPVSRADAERVAAKYLRPTTPGPFTARSRRPRAKATSSPKYRWTRQTLRKRRRNCF
jgi:hypothetical protein